MLKLSNILKLGADNRSERRRGTIQAEETRIDALRGLAALGVVLYHVRVDLWAGWATIQANPQAFSMLDRTSSWLGVPMRFIGAGVLLFFVISGYCIHRPQAVARKAENGKRTVEKREPVGWWFQFYVRRFMRIAPPYWVALALSAWVLAMTGGISEAGWQRIGSSALMVQNYWGLGGQVFTNPSLWSLPVELELYLVYPLAWWLGRAIGWGWVLVLAIFVSLAGQWGSLNGVRWLDASFPRFWALWCAGAWVAERRCRGDLPSWDWRWSVGFAGLLIAAASSEYMTNLQGASIWLWGLVGVLALVWAAGPVPQKSESFFTRLISLAAWIGIFSYSLYLIHYPLFHLAGHMWQGQFGGKPASILVSLAAVLLVIPVAWVFHRWIEAPSHRLARMLGRAKAHGGVVTQ